VGIQTVMLLYLNRFTFTSRRSSKLVLEVQAARQAGIKLILIHRKDSCAFGWIMDTTPRDLIEDGIYKTVAIDLVPTSKMHVRVSAALFAEALGAIRLEDARHSTVNRRRIASVAKRMRLSLNRSDAVRLNSHAPSVLAKPLQIFGADDEADDEEQQSALEEIQVSAEKNALRALQAKRVGDV